MKELARSRHANDEMGGSLGWTPLAALAVAADRGAQPEVLIGVR
jgi:hypothetical protein